MLAWQKMVEWLGQCPALSSLPGELSCDVKQGQGHIAPRCHTASRTCSVSQGQSEVVCKIVPKHTGTHSYVQKQARGDEIKETNSETFA